MDVAGDGLIATGRRVHALLGPSRGAIALAVAIGGAQAALLVPVAAVVRNVFDHQLRAGDSARVVLAGSIVLALYVGSAALGLCSRWLVIRIVRRVGARLRVELITHLYVMPPAWHDRQAVGMLHALVIVDSERAEQLVQTTANPVLPAVIVMVVLAVVAAIISPVLFACVFVTVPLTVLIAVKLSRRSRAKVRAWQRGFRTFSADTQLGLRMLRLSQTEGTENAEIERRAHEIETLADLRATYLWAQSANSQLYAVLAATTGVVALVIGGIAVQAHSLTLGGLLGFYAVITLILRQVTVIGPALASVAGGADSLARLTALLQLREDRPYEGTTTLEFAGAVTLEAVTFGYDTRPVIHRLDLDIAPGEHVALLGPNGSGKSTVASLLLGLYRPDEGRVLADGVPLDELNVRDLRHQIGVVPQNPVIFLGTVRDNIAYGDPEAGDAEIRAAAGWATAADFIEELEEGYETVVQDEGSRLSGGQRQRLALARALLGDPSLLILDEPTSYLDDESIRALLKNLDAMPSRPTVILITHDPEVAARTDRILYLRDGRVVGKEHGRGRPDTALGAV